MINSFVPAVTSPAVVPLALALYNSIGNLGGIIGPWLMGVMVEHTGDYSLAMQLLGCVMCTAAAMAYGTRGWETGMVREMTGLTSQQPSSRTSPHRESDHAGSRSVVELQGLLSHPAKD